MRILIRPRLPLLALLLLAPSIPELLTGSTPITRLAVDPLGFAVSFAFDVGLYGTGALVIREVAVILRRGWPSILLWGAAYGIAEEGLAVHTFFQPSGSPVDALAVYGSAYGVNWLWALGLTVFHATYSIALPILLTNLWFPQVRDARWVDRGGLAVLAGIYLAVVGVFAFLVGHGPSHGVLVLFLGMEAVLLVAGWRVPRTLVRLRPGPKSVGRWTLWLAGALEWIAWIAVLIVAGGRSVPAWGAALFVAAGTLGAAVVVFRGVGTEDLERSEYAFAVGMLVPLFAWDVLLEFIGFPGILAVSALFAYLLFRLGRTLDRRASPPSQVLAPRA